MKVQCEVQGLEDVRSKIAEMVPNLMQHMEESAGPQIAQVMRSVAVQNAPVGKKDPIRHPTGGGTLRQSLQTSPAIIERDDGSLAVHMGISTSVPYARYVEYGTGVKGDPAVPHTSKAFWFSYNPNYDDTRRECADNPKFLMWFAQEPNPFMRNALKSTRKIAVRLLAEGVGAVFK